jgi:hypothetical protein
VFIENSCPHWIKKAVSTSLEKLFPMNGKLPVLSAKEHYTTISTREAVCSTFGQNVCLAGKAVCSISEKLSVQLPYVEVGYN